MVIDPSTDLGKVRLRVGDFGDIPQLPDLVYEQVINDTKNADGTSNLRSASVLCGQYILAGLAFSVHQKMMTMEIYGAEAFANYKTFLTMMVKDPSFMGFAPIPYGAGVDVVHPLLQFQKDWTLNYVRGTQSTDLAINALGGGFNPVFDGYI